jgi:hypothetical protein
MPVVEMPVPTRAAPSAELVIKLQRALPAGATYRVTLTGLRNLLGNAGTTSRVLILPKPAPVAPVDSTDAPRPGTRPAAQRRDSSARVVPPPVRRPPTTRPPS